MACGCRVAARPRFATRPRSFGCFFLHVSTRDTRRLPPGAERARVETSSSKNGTLRASGARTGTPYALRGAGRFSAQLLRARRADESLSLALSARTFAARFAASTGRGVRPARRADTEDLWPVRWFFSLGMHCEPRSPRDRRVAFDESPSSVCFTRRSARVCFYCAFARLVELESTPTSRRGRGRESDSLLLLPI